MQNKIQITLNEQQYYITNSIPLIDLLLYLNYNLDLIVLEYNKRIIPKVKWPTILLMSNDQIEIITIVGGG
jgi:thiamine biosynthesis protein ThiS